MATPPGEHRPLTRPVHHSRVLFLTFSGLYIIDPKGILRHIQVNDYPVGRSVDEVLRLVQAFQFTDKHGEVCPAGWTPGAKTVRVHNLRGLMFLDSAQPDR